MRKIFSMILLCGMRATLEASGKGITLSEQFSECQLVYFEASTDREPTVEGKPSENNVLHSFLTFKELPIFDLSTEFVSITPYATRSMLDWLSQSDWKNLRSQYQAGKKTNWALFEALCHSFLSCCDLADRRVVYLRPLDLANSTPYDPSSVKLLELPVASPKKFHDLRSVSFDDEASSTMEYLWPIDSNQAGFDSLLYPGIVLQITVSASRPAAKFRTLRATLPLLLKKWKLPSVRYPNQQKLYMVVFMVPDFRFKDFHQDGFESDGGVIDPKCRECAGAGIPAEELEDACNRCCVRHFEFFVFGLRIDPIAGLSDLDVNEQSPRWTLRCDGVLVEPLPAVGRLL